MRLQIACRSEEEHTPGQAPFPPPPPPPPRAEGVRKDLSQDSGLQLLSGRVEGI